MHEVNMGPLHPANLGHVWYGVKVGCVSACSVAADRQHQPGMPVG